VIEEAEFGDESKFSIRCRIEYQRAIGSRNLVGTLEFKVAGTAIGNIGVISTVGIGARDLALMSGWSGLRRDDALYNTDKTAVLDLLDNSIYGEGGRADSERAMKFLACMTTSGNEWTDGWLIVLIEGAADRGQPDRMLYRRSTDRSDHEAFIPAGEYDRVVKSFLDWFHDAEKRWNVVSG